MAGGIGAGKSFIASLFGELGCVVVSSDEIVRRMYHDSVVVQTLKKWWGPMVLSPDGSIDRSAVARKIFQSPAERKRLESFLHPLANQQRERLMATAATDAKVLAFVWDTPLLFETGLDKLCDRTVFIDAPAELRQERVIQKRGWTKADLEERENSQFPLARKRELSQHVISNAADVGAARDEVRDVFIRILAEINSTPTAAGCDRD